jgi:hypothetical protein
LTLLWWLSWRRGNYFSRRLSLDTSLLALVSSVAISHVCSLSYMNWLLPLALLLALSVLPNQWMIWCLFVGLCVAILGVSNWIFPDHFLIDLVEFRSPAVAFAIVRGVSIIGLAMLLNWSFFIKYPVTSIKIHAS